MQEHRSANLGLIMLIALVTGNMIGSGIFTLPATLAGFGSISLLAWGAAAIGAMLIAYTLAQWSHICPKTGGPYAYCHAAFGNFIGFEVAYSYWIAIWVGNAAVAVALTSYLSVFIPQIQSDPWVGFGFKLAAVWILTAINLKGVKEAAIFQLIATIMKIIPLVLIGLIGIFFIHPEYFSAFNISPQSNAAALNASATLTFWAFIGLESATVPAEDVDNKNLIAIATLLGTGLTAIIYMICSAVVMGLVPNDVLMSSSAPFTDAISVLLPNHAATASQFIAICAVITCIGTLNGWILLQGQVPKAAAEDKLFPKFFNAENKHSAPHWGIIISSILVSLLLLMTMDASLIKQFNFIILIAIFFNMLPYTLSTLGALFYFKHFKSSFSQLHYKATQLCAFFATIFGIWALYGISWEVIPYTTLVLFSGIPIYFLYIKRQHHSLDD